MKRSRLYFILSNTFIFATSIVAIPVTLTVGSRASRLDNLAGIEYWQHIATFTILSNIFLALVALVAIFVGLKKSSKTLPQSFLTLYLSAASAAMVTCLTVVLFLAPMRAINGKNYFDMLLEPMFFLHFLNPILSAVTFVLFTSNDKLPKRSKFIATLPIIIYAIPYFLNVVILHTWPDFYGLTFGGHYFLIPVVFTVFWLLSFIIAITLIKLRQKFSSINRQNMLESK